MSLKQIVQSWNQFWFSPQSPVPASLARILFGLLFIQFAVFLAPELHNLFGSKAMVSFELAHSYSPEVRFSILDFLPQDAIFLDCVFWFFVLSAVCLTLGLFTRLSALLVYVGLISLDARNFYAFGAPDMVLRTVAFLLIFTQAGNALSMDRLLNIWLRKIPETGPAAESPPWGLRLIQVFFAFVYWVGFSRKIIGSKWLDGTAVYYVAHYLDNQRFILPSIFDNVRICKLLTWSTLAVEFAMFTLIWIDEFRIPVILIGIAFHLIMDMTLNLGQFQFIMIAGLVSFIPPSTLGNVMRTIRSYIHKLIAEPVNVFYDATFDSSFRLAETVRRLDIFQLLSIAEEGLDKTAPSCAGLYIHVNDRWVSGIEAARIIALRLPLTAMFYPFLFLPGANRCISCLGDMITHLYPDRKSV
jgi:uncharacterized membrane protein YphA (DoxX/SURF4 family)